MAADWQRMARIGQQKASDWQLNGNKWQQVFWETATEAAGDPSRLAAH